MSHPKKKPTNKKQQNPRTRSKTKEQGSRARSSVKVLIATLSTLGILSGIGAYYLPGILKSGGNLITSQIPLEYKVTLAAWDPKYLFLNSVSPKMVPSTILQAALDNPESVLAFKSWAEHHGGIMIAPQIQLVLRARDASPIIINDLAVQVTRQYPATAGWFNSWYGCGGVVDVRSVEFNLDKRPFGVTWLNPPGTSIKPPVLSVTDTDSEVIDVEVYTAEPIVFDWVINISYSAAGRQGTLRIDNNGNPFTATSLLGSFAYSLITAKPRLDRDPSADPGTSGSSINGTDTC
jgi:hypothetical protein